MMRGVGGPLLCIADLLSDLSASTDGDVQTSLPSISVGSSSSPDLKPSDLHRLFELCSALETADKLLQTADTNSESLLEKIDVLNGILKRGDSAVAVARGLCESQNVKEGPSV
ncbi:hypothetical protein QJS10_CPB19g01783 [Acorus calamus]|uniref:Uncharacterized protein n=1 Tax=Acorus calamus TaxID=4465 RepID=A0AAV9CGP0_ACOCL|nr:hypothetical protein QJS10_CPB19g01745 [Acorus calamus]KAK1288115.1 hypothetical protein QJS10_CPB19g01783 [Acorus calamus]